MNSLTTPPTTAISTQPTALFLSTIHNQKRNWFPAFPLGLVLPISALLIWEAVSALGWITAHLLPPPSALLRTFTALAGDGSLAVHIGVSAARVLTGFVIGGSCGLLIGALVALNRRVNDLVDPSLQALRAVPSLAWVPLLLLWLGIDVAPKFTLIAIGTFFPMYLATVASLRDVDRKLVEVGRQLGFRKRQLLTKIYLPAALPGLFTGLRTALGLGWMFLVAAELIAATSGLGYLLTDGRETGRTDLVLVAIITLALLGKSSDAVLVYIERLSLRWRDVADPQANSDREGIKHV
ncbi:MAG: ABC transporter permease [Burkholderiales bacterium]